MLIGIQIRPAVATDFPRLMAIDHSVTSDYVWQLDLRKGTGQVHADFREVRLPRPVKVQYPRSPEGLADEWGQSSVMFTAQRGDDPVGYVMVQEHSFGATAWVTDLVVSLESRRKGIGGALLTAAHDWAVSQGDRDIFLEMSSKNNPCIRLAHKFGFEFCGYNDHYYVTKDVALFFGRTLV